jgi:hypothetical protein
LDGQSCIFLFLLLLLWVVLSLLVLLLYSRFFLSFFFSSFFSFFLFFPQYYQHVESATRELVQRFTALRSHMQALSLEVTGVAKQQLQERNRRQEQAGQGFGNDNTDEMVGFPFITVPMFEVSAHQMRERSGLEMVVFSPLVEKNQTQQWIQFSQDKFQEWYGESIEYHAYSAMDEKGNLRVNSYDTNATVPGSLWYFTGGSLMNAYPVDQGDGPFLPAWLTSPPPFSPRLMNIDTLQIPYIHRMVPLLRETRDILLSEVSNGLQASIGTSVSKTDHQAYHDRFITTMPSSFDDGADGNDDMTTATAKAIATLFPPHAVVLQPVWDRLYADDEHDEDDNNANEPPSKLVGLVSGIVAWDFYVAGLLPEGTRGIYVVLKNSCGQQYTYWLDGPKVRCWW